jgi:hypothetical protein
MKTTYTATAADGQTYTRKSERAYTHAAIVTLPHGGVEVKFSSSRDLAVKAGNAVVAPARWMRPGMECFEQIMAAQAATTVEIVEVTA